MGDIHAEYVDIHYIMQENSEHLGEKNYLVSLDQQKCLTFSEINYYSNKVANFLKNKGVKKDDKICLIGENSIETMIIFFGVLKYGAIISPLNVDESKENIHHIINRLSPRFVIHDEKINFDHANTTYSWIPLSDFDREKRTEGDFSSLIRDYDFSFKTPIAGRNDIAEIFSLQVLQISQKRSSPLDRVFFI